MEIQLKSIQEFVNLAENKSPDIDELFQIAQNLLDTESDQKTIHTFLDIGHFPTINTLILNNDRIDEWINILHKLIIHSKYSFGHLFYKRSLRYQYHILFNIFNGNEYLTYTYKDIWEKLLQIAAALEFERSALPQFKVGILSPNSLQSALVDIACLSFHYPVVPIPANSTDNDIDFIVKHSGITHLFLGGDKNRHWQDIVLSHYYDLKIIKLETSDWDSFITNTKGIDPLTVLKRISRVDMNANATVMYTSGTTGEPKGISFTQENMIFKRFARALALPELCSKDVFLCYLPLYHTFGRFLELQGSIFWGASYTFAENTSFDMLRKNFLQFKPSVFISIPKRWTQLYELVLEITANKQENPKLIRRALKKVTGGNLRWGLSAAGYLDPDIFHFFHTNGINLLSGYGMTEATGGITMTPPGEYIIESVGKSLPGIEIKLAEDGELLMRGPYVISHYFGNPPVPADTDGWFHSRDIFTEKDGYFFITDRKKEIYKNASGQTISPQKIENMLQEFEAVQSAFLIGDRKNFNTVLIYPNPQYLDEHFPKRETNKIRESIGALIHTVNGFLSPFERIVNYAVIHREFNLINNERTQKGTYRRKNILKNWSDVISPMYSDSQAMLESNGKTIVIPNWLLKKLNTVPQDIKWSGKYLKIISTNQQCICKWIDNILQLGEYKYLIHNPQINLEKMLLNPRLWLGNKEFSEFIGPTIFQVKHFKKTEEIVLLNRIQSTYAIPDNAIVDSVNTLPLYHLHNGVMCLNQKNISGLNYFKDIMDKNDFDFKQITLDLMVEMMEVFELKISRQLLNFSIPFLDNNSFINSLRNLYLRHQENKKVRSWKVEAICMGKRHIHAVLKELAEYRLTHNEANQLNYSYIRMLMFLCLDLCRFHASQYYNIRHELTCWKMRAANDQLNHSAKKYTKILNIYFRKFIGKHDSEAVPPITYTGHNWSEIVQFDPSVPEPEQKLIMDIFLSKPIVQESVLILTGNREVYSHEISKNGIWITRYTVTQDVIQYRVLLTLKDDSVFNFIISYLPNTTKEEIIFIRDWQIVMSSGIESKNLTANYLTSWPEMGIIISEFDPGGNVFSFLQINSDEISDPKLHDRWDMRWLHLGWSCLQAYVHFWYKTEFQYMLLKPSVQNVIVSEYDYVTHVRLKNTFFIQPQLSLLESLSILYNDLILDTESIVQGLNHVIDWEILFTCILQSAGIKQGLFILKKFANEIQESDSENNELNVQRVQVFIDDVESYGYLPKPVVFAALRFQRWMDLNPNVTVQAQCDIIQELYKDYRLNDLYPQNPEIRLRYFLMTCFRDHESYVSKELLMLTEKLHNGLIQESELESSIHTISIHKMCSKNESFFLTHLIYQHVDSADYAELITGTSGKRTLDLIVSVKDKENKQFKIRPPFKPKEIAAFHDLLLSNNLPANFNEEHDFLLIFTLTNNLAGGIYWKPEEQKTIHVEKIAIQKQYQKKGLGFLLLNELLQQSKKNGIKYATTGFLKADFFQYHGFDTDESFAGLVKEL